MAEHSQNSQIHAVPRGAILSYWNDLDFSDCVHIDRLEELTTLAVRTAHSLYEITILDGSAGEVLVRGGWFFKERTVTVLSGSSFGGSILKSRCVCVGMKLEFVPQPVETFSEVVIDKITGEKEFRLGHKIFWTSPVQSVGILT